MKKSVDLFTDTKLPLVFGIFYLLFGLTFCYLNIEHTGERDLMFKRATITNANNDWEHFRLKRNEVVQLIHPSSILRNILANVSNKLCLLPCLKWELFPTCSDTFPTHV